MAANFAAKKGWSRLDLIPPGFGTGNGHGASESPESSNPIAAASVHL